MYRTHYKSLKDCYFICDQERSGLYDRAVNAQVTLYKKEGGDIAHRALAEAMRKPLKALFVSRNDGIREGQRFAQKYDFLDNAPLRDHPSYWRKEGKPACLVIHTYGKLDLDAMKEIIAFCEKNKLNAQVHPYSWYFADNTLMITYELQEIR